MSLLLEIRHSPSGKVYNKRDTIKPSTAHLYALYSKILSTSSPNSDKNCDKKPKLSYQQTATVLQHILYCLYLSILLFTYLLTYYMHEDS